ncbi:hypothetical protein ACIPX0_12045 [Streptomyces sp. NPDC090075]|uniref:hypothetical protein n=1 Tax=Streptomyces sp. NPDC090075 TaxID=3365937 RepID=UPI003816E09E
MATGVRPGSSPAHTLRTLDDALALRDRLGRRRPAHRHTPAGGGPFHRDLFRATGIPGRCSKVEVTKE